MFTVDSLFDEDPPAATHRAPAKKRRTTTQLQQPSQIPPPLQQLCVSYHWHEQREVFTVAAEDGALSQLVGSVVHIAVLSDSSVTALFADGLCGAVLPSMDAVALVEPAAPTAAAVVYSLGDDDECLRGVPQRHASAVGALLHAASRCQQSGNGILPVVHRIAAQKRTRCSTPPLLCSCCRVAQLSITDLESHLHDELNDDGEAATPQTCFVLVAAHRCGRTSSSSSSGGSSTPWTFEIREALCRNHAPMRCPSAADVHDSLDNAAAVLTFDEMIASCRAQNSAGAAQRSIADDDDFPSSEESSFDLFGSQVW